MAGPSSSSSSSFAPSALSASAIVANASLDPQALSLARELARRNSPMSDAELDALLPEKGYKILEPPEDYQPAKDRIGRAGGDLLKTPMDAEGGGGQEGFQMFNDATLDKSKYGIGGVGGSGMIGGVGFDGGEVGSADGLPFIKQEDYQYFGKLMDEGVDEASLGKAEQRERAIMALLLKIKCGTPPQRKTAMRQITDKAVGFGAGPLFNQILPLLMSPTLTDQVPSEAKRSKRSEAKRGSHNYNLCTQQQILTFHACITCE